MTEALTTVPTAQALAPSSALTREQLDLLKRTLCKGASDDEFTMFLEVCQRRRIDPFSKMLYLVPRWDSKLGREVMAVQSSIDYFRLTAGRSDKYAGQAGPQWCGADGQWVDVWLKPEAPRAARVGVMCKDFKEPLWAVALWDSYVQKTNKGEVTKFWKTMGPLMLGKCAEALAIRRAFPEDLAGLYTPEEMSQDVREVEHIEVDRRTGEVLNAPKPEPVAQPRTIDTTATQKPAQAAPAGDLPKVTQADVDAIDWDELPIYTETGVTLWGVPVTDKVRKNWAHWKRYKAIDSAKKPDSRSSLLDRSWQEASEGSIGGKREMGLKWAVALARRDVAMGKEPIEWSQRAAYTLYTMLEERLRAANDAAAGQDFEQKTGIATDSAAQDSEDSLPF